MIEEMEGEATVEEIQRQNDMFHFFFLSGKNCLYQFFILDFECVRMNMHSVSVTFLLHFWITS